MLCIYIYIYTHTCWMLDVCVHNMCVYCHPGPRLQRALLRGPQGPPPPAAIVACQYYTNDNCRLCNKTTLYKC